MKKDMRNEKSTLAAMGLSSKPKMLDPTLVNKDALGKIIAVDPEQGPIRERRYLPGDIRYKGEANNQGFKM